ncbi:hypothetical protein DXT88_03795 [Herbaspirillum lusitanum]|uniref:sensor histidine kinase n=1 Tax=Herbaspirillum lusitanum TaxID=213312 RepID=UPI002237D435|nr:sensor histidine kinase [Herbaspirillum lusitanum]MCW5297290.1 hypothetical protein [Herbaspirillum lusitanum]
MTAMQTWAARTVLSQGSVVFDVEARLLQELGERLVASPEVAILELVKNASDADAPECRVSLTSEKGRAALVIADNGAGMSEDDFRTRWMRIAADSKRNPTTKKYGRAVTGQKGIGRFAIRFLGAAVRLDSISVDPATGQKQKLEAIFDWRRLDRNVNLRDAKVPFRVTIAPSDSVTGTKLTVTRLKGDLGGVFSKALLTRVLQIVSPISAFDAGPFARLAGNGEESDPGFSVNFYGFPQSDDEPDLAKAVIGHAWARLKIKATNSKVKYIVTFRDDPEKVELEFDYPNEIKSGLYADIVFAPKRKDAFHGIAVDRREVWTWIRKNSGIGIIDNGFRIRPYGFTDDDWLYLNQDGAHNRRTWRSLIAEENFSLSEMEQARPGLNPALNVPTSYQVIGAVNVSSRAPAEQHEIDLIPAMDREGFLINLAYHQMVEIVRGGIEFLAKADKERLLKIEETLAIQNRAELREDLAETVDAIENDPRLASEEKAALVNHYSQLAVRVVEQEEYDRNARQRLEIAAGLGVVAGFMTHEAEKLFLALDSVIKKLKLKASTEKALHSDISEIQEARDRLDGYIRYTRLYTDSLRSDELRSFSALGQIEWVIDNFGRIAESRGIKTNIDCDDELLAPSIPVAMYSAVLLNLYSNATKAIIARGDDRVPPQILIAAKNDGRFHYLTVHDTGVGIPPQLRRRIWDPFFTTTSRVNSPLGTGMGLGLSLVKDLVQRVGGRAEIIESPTPFSTSIRIAIPRGSNEK